MQRSIECTWLRASADGAARHACCAPCGTCTQGGWHRRPDCRSLNRPIAASASHCTLTCQLGSDQSIFFRAARASPRALCQADCHTALRLRRHAVALLRAHSLCGKRVAARGVGRHSQLDRLCQTGQGSAARPTAPPAQQRTWLLTSARADTPGPVPIPWRCGDQLGHSPSGAVQLWACQLDGGRLPTTS